MKKGTGLLLIISTLVLIFIIIIVKSYGSLSSLKEDVNNRESDLNVQLTRKKEQISNLISLEYFKDSEEINEIEKINESFIKGEIKDKKDVNDKVSSLLNQLFENMNKELLKNETISKVIDELLATEKRINTAKTNYNNAVEDYNKKVSSFPSSIIASIRGFNKVDTFDSQIEIKDYRESE